MVGCVILGCGAALKGGCVVLRGVSMKGGGPVLKNGSVALATGCVPLAGGSEIESDQECCNREGSQGFCKVICCPLLENRRQAEDSCGRCACCEDCEDCIDGLQGIHH